MQSQLKFAGIAGSIRTNSNSRIILQAIADILPADSELTVLDIAHLPLYNQDLEMGALPSSVIVARQIIAENDAVIIVSPEFNHGMPGVLKNALDWLSRPAFNNPMVNKYVFFVTQSPSPLGGVRAQYQLRETLSAMLCNIVPLPEVAISQTHEKIVNGVFNDESTLAYLKKQMETFLQALSCQSSKAS